MRYAAAAASTNCEVPVETSLFSAAATNRGLLMASLVFLALGPVSAQTEQPKRILANGVELHYIERGQGEPLILLHGGQGTIRVAAANADALSAISRHFIQPSLPLPERDPLTAGDHSALIDAADLAGLIAELNWVRCTSWALRTGRSPPWPWPLSIRRWSGAWCWRSRRFIDG